MTVISFPRIRTAQTSTMTLVPNRLPEYFNNADLPVRDAVITAMMETVQAMCDDANTIETVMAFGVILEGARLSSDGLTGFSLASALMDAAERIYSLNNGGDPLWYAERNYRGSADALRVQLIDAARDEWDYLLSRAAVA